MRPSNLLSPTASFRRLHYALILAAAPLVAASPSMADPGTAVLAGARFVSPQCSQNRQPHRALSREESERLLLRKQEREERMAEEAQRRADEAQRRHGKSKARD